MVAFALSHLEPKGCDVDEAVKDSEEAIGVLKPVVRRGGMKGATAKRSVELQARVIRELERLRRVALEGDRLQLELLKEQYRGYVRRLLEALENIRRVERRKRVARLF